MSIPFYWPDEFAFIKHNDIIFKSAAPAISKVAETAELHGRPHGKIISTTPSNIDVESGAFCKKILDEACAFIEDMYDWSREKVLEYIRANSSNDFINIRYTWQQLGYDAEWYDKQCRDLFHDWITIKREIDLVWTKSSENSVFKEEELDCLYTYIDQNSSSMVLEVERVNEESGEVTTIPYSFVLHKPLVKDRVYFVGVDVAGGLGRDFSTIVITDPTDNYKTVATFKNNKINIKQFAMLQLALIRKLIPKSILFIESNNYGKGVIDILIDFIPKNLYFEYKVSDKDKTAVNPSTVTDTITYGISTTSKSRDLMIDLARTIVLESPEQIVSNEIYSDIKGLIYTKSGKVEHDAGMHDDSLFGYLMVRYAVDYGNNIAKYLRDIKATKKQVTALSNITGSKAAQNLAIDPAVNKGVDIDFNELLRLTAAGENIDDIKKRLERLANSNKTGRKSSTADPSLVALLLHKGNNR